MRGREAGHLSFCTTPRLLARWPQQTHDLHFFPLERDRPPVKGQPSTHRAKSRGVSRPFTKTDMRPGEAGSVFLVRNDAAHKPTMVATTPRPCVSMFVEQNPGRVGSAAGVLELVNAQDRGVASPLYLHRNRNDHFPLVNFDAGLNDPLMPADFVGADDAVFVLLFRTKLPIFDQTPASRHRGLREHRLERGFQLLGSGGGFWLNRDVAGGFLLGIKRRVQQ